MNNLVINNYLAIIDRLDLDAKLSLLTALTENIKTSIQPPTPSKTERMHQLFGAWSDTDESLIEDIYSHRSLPDREISFD